MKQSEQVIDLFLNYQFYSTNQTQFVNQIVI